MVARRLTLIVCATVLFACAADNIRDLSNHPRFNKYAGRTVHLLRPAYLIEEDFWTGPQYGLSEQANMKGALNRPLPVGHPIHLDSVKINPAFSPYALALGHTFVPALGKEVPFHFYWADPGGIGRAPWEPKSDTNLLMTRLFSNRHKPSNQSMKPRPLVQMDANDIATDPARGLSLSR